MNRDRSISAFLGLNRNIVLLLCGIVTIGSGEEMWMRFLPKYLESVGASALLIALYDALKTLLGAVYAFPGGLIVDRWGHRRAFIAFTVLSIAGYAAVLALPGWAGVIFGMFLFLAWSNLSLPATFSLVGRSLPAGKHAMGIGVQSLVRRLPVIVGPIAGGVLMDRLGLVRGVRAGIVLTILLAASATLFQSRIRADDPPSGNLRWNFLRHLRDFDPRLRRLLFSDILIRFCERIPYAWVVIYAMDNRHVTATQMGLLIAIEMGMAIACYVPAAHLADRYGREPYVIATFLFFTAFPVSLMFATSFSLLAAAFAIRGLKEFGEPARKSLIISYAPEDRRGQVIGTYYLLRDTIVTTGSFVGAVLWEIGPRVNFGGAALFGALGTFFYIRTVVRKSSGKLKVHPAGDVL